MTAAAQTAPGPLSYPEFRLYLIGRLLTTIAVQMQSVAIGWQVYDLTHRARDLGFVGLALFAPSLVLLLLTGHAADRYDRRTIVVLCFAVEALCCLIFGLMSLGRPDVLTIYALLLVLGSARAFAAPAQATLVPNIVPAASLQSAFALSSSSWQTATILGPAVGGFVYAFAGPVGVYNIAALMIAVGASATLLMSPKRPLPGTGGGDDGGFSRALAGLRYIRSRPAILGAIALDMVAVLCGGATALLPLFARDILKTGPEGLGALRAAPAIGALAVAVLLAVRPLNRHAGALMLGCVGLFGVATIVFGLSHDFALSLGALTVLGAADMVSVNVRQTLIQLGTPDNMRGRVSAANSVFIGASNELGELRAGFMGDWFGGIGAVVVGGIGTVILVALWTVLFPTLRRVDRLADIGRTDT